MKSALSNFLSNSGLSANVGENNVFIRITLVRRMESEKGLRIKRVG